MENEAFILDFNLLSEQGLSVSEFITIIHLKNDIIYNDSEYHLKELENKQFIKLIANDRPVLREKGKILIDLISIQNVNINSNKKKIVKSSRLINSELDGLVVKFRNKFKGLKPGSMGSESSCKFKLHRWMMENPTYNADQILNAVDVYIKSLNNYTYLQQADYFIYKKEGKDEQSKLSAFIDEVIVEDDWMTNLK